MHKKLQAPAQESHLLTIKSLNIDGFEIGPGDIIKIQGEYGSRFKFIGVTTNKLTGASWVDCFEIINGVSSVFRSFSIDKVKRIPQRGKRAKRVDN